MTLGDTVVVHDKTQIEKILPYLVQRLEEWSYGKPCAIKLMPYIDKPTDNQMALVHVWFRDMAKYYSQKVPVTEKKMKLLMKHKFLGVKESVGRTEMEFVRSLNDLDKGEMQYFMDQVYDWALEHGCSLKIPHDSEYMKLREAQVK
ncbi:MAG: hypothetical protein ACPH4D_01500 [Porticoccaceae bacterium]